MRNRSEFPDRGMLVLALLLLLPVAARAADREFHSLVERMSDYFEKRPMRFVGWLNFVANRFTTDGVSHFQVAIFDDIDTSRLPPDEGFESSLERLIGPSYQPFVRVHDVRSGDWNLIYIRETREESFEMVIVSIDSTDAVLIKMQVKPDAMHEWVDEPVKKGRDSRYRANDFR